MDWEKYFDPKAKAFFWKNMRSGTVLWKDPETATAAERQGAATPSPAVEKTVPAKNETTQQRHRTDARPPQPSARPTAEVLRAAQSQRPAVSSQPKPAQPMATRSQQSTDNSPRGGRLTKEQFDTLKKLALGPRHERQSASQAQAAPQKSQAPTAEQAAEMRRARLRYFVSKRSQNATQQQAEKPPADQQQQHAESKPLPPHLRQGSQHTQWVKHWDADQGAYYWQNLGTGETKWAE